MDTNWLLVGLGNEFRRDDGLGPFVVRHSIFQSFENLFILENEGDCTQIFETERICRQILIVDAVRSGRRPGTVFHLEIPGNLDYPEVFSYSTHGIGLLECIAIAKVTGAFPDRLVFLGVEGKDFGYGQGLCMEVRKGAEEVLATIVRILGGTY
ncbi:MAG: hydrogenase maturation protease [Bacteroidota bacterium]|nr:hydrogenase maturation protease [Bacteroidota bacterium]